MKPLTAFLILGPMLAVAVTLAIYAMLQPRHYSCAPFPFENAGAVCDANGNPVLRRGIK